MSTPNMPDAAILCGGQGTRLRSVLPDLPKPMAPLNGRPFLDRLISELNRNGIGHVVLCCGYRNEVIKAHFAERNGGPSISYSVEDVPLGTGGALVQALPLCKTDPVLVLNGDSYVPGLDLREVVAFHQARRAGASMVVVPADSRHDAGNVLLDQAGYVQTFAEKQSVAGQSYHSAGIYLLARSVMRPFESGGVLSLEKDMVPAWMQLGLLGFVHPGTLVDIGTPDRLIRARESQKMQKFGDLPLEECRHEGSGSPNRR